MQNSVLEREKIMKRLAIGLGAAVLALTGAVAQVERLRHRTA